MPAGDAEETHAYHPAVGRLQGRKTLNPKINEVAAGERNSTLHRRRRKPKRPHLDFTEGPGLRKSERNNYTGHFALGAALTLQKRERKKTNHLGRKEIDEELGLTHSKRSVVLALSSVHIPFPRPSFRGKESA